MKLIVERLFVIVTSIKCLTRISNHRYDGDFQNDMKEGYGTLSYTNGEKYEVPELSGIPLPVCFLIFLLVTSFFVIYLLCNQLYACVHSHTEA